MDVVDARHRWIAITATIAALAHLGNSLFHFHPPHWSFAAGSLKPSAIAHHHRHGGGGNYSASGDDFLLRCPRPSEHEWDAKANFSLRLSRLSRENTLNATALTIAQSGKAPGGELLIQSTTLRPLEVRQWRTLNRRIAALIYTSDGWSFEFEEAKRWFALRTKPTAMRHGGRWLCELTLLFRNGSRVMSETSRVFVPASPPTTLDTDRPKPTRRRRIKSHHSHRGMAEMPNDTPPQFFSFSKHESGLAVFQRLSKFDKITYARGGDSVEYSRNRPHYGHGQAPRETPISAEVGTFPPSSQLNNAALALGPHLPPVIGVLIALVVSSSWLPHHPASATPTPKQ